MGAAPHLESAERPMPQVWVHGTAMPGLTEAELWTHMALGMLPAYDEGPDSLDDYDHSYALGHAAQERWHRYVSEETDDVIIRLPTGVLLYHFQLRGM